MPIITQNIFNTTEDNLNSSTVLYTVGSYLSIDRLNFRFANCFINSSQKNTRVLGYDVKSISISNDIITIVLDNIRIIYKFVVYLITTANITFNSSSLLRTLFLTVFVTESNSNVSFKIQLVDSNEIDDYLSDADSINKDIIAYINLKTVIDNYDTLNATDIFDNISINPVSNRFNIVRVFNSGVRITPGI